jgi:hypothetical protein
MLLLPLLPLFTPRQESDQVVSYLEKLYLSSLLSGNKMSLIAAAETRGPEPSVAQAVDTLHDIW